MPLEPCVACWGVEMTDFSDVPKMYGIVVFQTNKKTKNMTLEVDLLKTTGFFTWEFELLFSDVLFIYIPGSPNTLKKMGSRKSQSLGREF